MTTSEKPRQQVAPFGSILDVPGVAVGHHQRTGRGWLTGTTVVVVPDGATPGVDVRGGGPGTRETDALRPENLIEQIHAITLTGGSAFGLAAADGVVSTLEARGLGFPIADTVVPVVPAAVIFDVGRGGVTRNRPDASFGERAVRSALARRHAAAWGAVGAGTGARAGGLQGGVGTASVRLRVSVAPATTPIESSGVDQYEVVVGALAVVNANGSPIDPATALPWEARGRVGPRPGPTARASILEALSGQADSGLNTTIGVVATSARLTKAECSKMATVAHDGMARAIRPAHSMTDGDTVFALATGAHELTDTTCDQNGDGDRNVEQTVAVNRILGFNRLLAAAADVFADACTHAVVAARTVGDTPAWSDLRSQ